MTDVPRLATPAPGVMASTTNSYDEVPYESYPYSQTHPSRLATIATLFGLKPPSVERCRVLELGCAGGGNGMTPGTYAYTLTASNEATPNTPLVAAATTTIHVTVP